MAFASTPDIDQILSAIPHLHRGPGGSAAVLKDGEVIGQSSWGYANLNTRAPMTPDTLMPICSISKQMVCLAMVSLCRDPTPAMLVKKEDPWQLLDAELKRMLPHLVGLPDGELTVAHLCHMQSGIRDYWAMTTLYGARPDDTFSIHRDAPQTLDRIKSFHFAPGTEYSYSNVNFHVLGRILENVSGQSLAHLLSERVFVPAGMKSAYLYINTNGLPLPIAGYEGNEKVGYFEALNRMEWAGDAGIAASLEDMIAYEKYLDRSISDPASLYYHTSQQQTYKDGTPARYGFGLGRLETSGKAAIGHGGALRGFKLMRMHIPSERVSVVVMFNHETSPGPAALYILKQMVGYQDVEHAAYSTVPEWNGDYLDEGTQLYINVEPAKEKPGQLSIDYDRASKDVHPTSASTAESDDMKATIEGDVLHVHRISDHRILRANRITRPSELELYSAKSADYVGAYRCDEVDSIFHCTGNNGTLYASFDGFLGRGPIWLMRYLGDDVWIMGNPRGLDSSPPGDWTVIFERVDGKVAKVTIGCWLARKVKYVRTS